MLEHTSIPLITCWKQLLIDCSALSTFTSRIESITKKIAGVDLPNTNPYFSTSGKDASNKFKGDVFEIFCELLIRLSPIDDRIGIADYHLISRVEDVGVDGYGIARDGTPATVQCKYRQWDWDLNVRDHLNNFRWTSFNRFGVDPNSVGKMLILTTGKGLNWNIASRQFMGMVRCISANSS